MPYGSVRVPPRGRRADYCGRGRTTACGRPSAKRRSRRVRQSGRVRHHPPVRPHPRGVRRGCRPPARGEQARPPHPGARHRQGSPARPGPRAPGAPLLPAHGPRGPRSAATPSTCSAPSVSHRRAAQNRPQGTAVVHAFTPSVEGHGWSAGHTVIEIVTDDMPFLVDSVTGEPGRAGPRDPPGRSTRSSSYAATSSAHLQEVARRSTTRPTLPEGAIVESWMHVEIDRETDAATLTRHRGAAAAACCATSASRSRTGRGCARGPRGVGRRARGRPAGQRRRRRGRRVASTCCAGWSTTTSPSSATASTSLSRADGEHARRPCPAPGSASCAPTGRSEPRRRHAARRRSGRGARAAAARAHQGQHPLHRAPRRPTSTTSASRRSTTTATWSGERRFLGLFTSTAYTESVLRDPGAAPQGATQVLERSGFRADSHAGKDLLAGARDLPARRAVPGRRRASSTETALAVLHMQERRQTRLFLAPRRLRPLRLVPGLPAARPLHHHRAPADGRRSCGTPSTASSSTTPRACRESVLARLHFVVRGRPGQPLPDVDRTTRSRRASPRRPAPGTTSSATRCVDQCGEERGRPPAATGYGDAFPEAYKEDFAARTGVADVRQLEALGEDGERRAEPLRAARGRRRRAPLQDLPPRRRDLAVDGAAGAAAAWASRSSTSGRTRSTRADGTDAAASTTSACASRRRARLRAAGSLKRALRGRVRSPRGAGRAEADGFNALVARRAASPGARRWCCAPYAKYLRQTGTAFSQDLPRGRAWSPTCRSPRLLVRAVRGALRPARSPATARPQTEVAARGDRRRARRRSPASTTTASCARSSR